MSQRQDTRLDQNAKMYGVLRTRLGVCWVRLKQQRHYLVERIVEMSDAQVGLFHQLSRKVFLFPKSALSKVCVIQICLQSVLISSGLA